MKALYRRLTMKEFYEVSSYEVSSYEVSCYEVHLKCPPDMNKSFILVVCSK